MAGAASLATRSKQPRGQHRRGGRGDLRRGSGLQGLLGTGSPNFPAIAQRVGNQQDQVGAFAADFVTTWLTATSNQRSALQQFITLADNTVTLPTTPAAVVTTPQIVSVIHTGTVGDAGLFAATISLNERPYASAEATRAFYRVPVSMWNYQPVRWRCRPGSAARPGADFKITYRQALSADSPVLAVVSGFIRTYLTATTGLDRYVVADTVLAGGDYQSAVVTTAAADRPVPDTAPSGAEIHVLANVTAQTSQFANVSLVYPLTLKNSGGTWMVAAIDLMPEVGETEPNPIGAPHS